MFKLKSITRSSELHLVPVSLISAGTVIRGNLESAGDIRIDGTLIGNLYCKAKILIGADGVVEGDICGEQADILGTVTGRVKINGLLYLHGDAVVEGDIHSNKLQIESSANFNGQCHMGANVVELNPEMAAVVNE